MIPSYPGCPAFERMGDKHLGLFHPLAFLKSPAGRWHAPSPTAMVNSVCRSQLGRHAPPPTPAWAGAHVLVSNEGIGFTCGPEEWHKAQGLLQDLSEQLQQSSQLVYKDLEQKRGFLVHIQGTYPCITPFLKGLHLTWASASP